ncbi:hypothetical protein PHYBOEH_004711 [Phytophthora boehmeriae]|uniref:Uncharacterized protein n=1 Tax=Phytophthora boehmeriae TaxID=109152 RepID=A0A8T1WLF4_9STRA|nr:hypothetical protein PHYBOEH_004711 [Phytophthora boehmeriae]
MHDKIHWLKNLLPPSSPLRRSQSDRKLLAMQPMTLEAFLQEEEQMAKDQTCDSSARPIPALLLPNETLEQYEESFILWLGRRNVTVPSLQDEPIVERRFRLDFADSRAWELRRRNIASVASTSHKSAVSNPDHHEVIADGTSASRSEGGGKAKPAGRHPYQGIRSRKELLAKSVMNVDQFSARMEYFGPNGDMFAGSRLSPIAVVLRPYETLAEFELNFKRWLAMKKVSLNMLQDDPEEERRYRQCFAHAQSVAEVTDNQLADVVFIKTEQSRSAVIFQEATATLEKSVRMNEDLVKKRLTQDYTRLTDQIASNETSIEDSLAYVNLIVNIDKAGTADHLNQIKKLTISINKEKRRRDTVLATLIAHDWSDRHEELNSHLHRRDRGRNPSGSHEKLVSIYGKLEKKGDEMLALQAKLKSRLGWLNGGDTGRDAQFEELQELKNRMEVEISALSRLEVQRQMLCVDLLRSNEAVCRLAMELIEEPKHTTAKAKATPV